MPYQEQDPIETMRRYARCHAESLPGSPASTGLEIASLIRTLSNHLDTLTDQVETPFPISGPRFGLLMRLHVAETQGLSEGLTPTQLSHLTVVSKNTISSLLRGLEKDGYVIRELDPHDRRVFRIRLSPSGRDLVAKCGPQRLAQLNHLVSALSPTEQARLANLLTHLVHSICTWHGGPAPLVEPLIADAGLDEG